MDRCGYKKESKIDWLDHSFSGSILVITTLRKRFYLLSSFKTNLVTSCGKKREQTKVKMIDPTIFFLTSSFGRGESGIMKGDGKDEKDGAVG